MVEFAGSPSSQELSSSFRSVPCEGVFSDASVATLGIGCTAQFSSSSILTVGRLELYSRVFRLIQFYFFCRGDHLSNRHPPKLCAALENCTLIHTRPHQDYACTINADCGSNHIKSRSCASYCTPNTLSNQVTLGKAFTILPSTGLACTDGDGISVSLLDGMVRTEVL